MCVVCTQSRPALWDPTGYSPPGSAVHGIVHARILEWVTIPFSMGSSQTRDQTHFPFLGRRILSYCTTISYVHP